jgi:hypothetical protein
VTDLSLLQEFYREKLAIMLEHQAASHVIAQYDVNNTYQYVINRDDVQLSWVSDAIADLGGAVPDAAPKEPIVSGKGDAVARAVIEQGAREAQAFVERWRPRVEAMTNARHRGTLRVILGETLEQKRFFDQALAGRQDLLGRRGKSLGPPRGEVLPGRWIE